MRQIPFVEVLAVAGVYPRLTTDGHLRVFHDAENPLHAAGLHTEARDYVIANRGLLVAELVAWATSGTPPSPACCPDGAPPQGRLGRVPAKLLEGAEAALAALDEPTQDALTLAVLRGAGCEAIIEGAELALRGPTPDVHALLAEHAEALGRALRRSSRDVRTPGSQVGDVGANHFVPPYAPE